MSFADRLKAMANRPKGITVTEDQSPASGIQDDIVVSEAFLEGEDDSSVVQDSSEQFISAEALAGYEDEEKSQGEVSEEFPDFSGKQDISRLVEEHGDLLSEDEVAATAEADVEGKADVKSSTDSSEPKDIPGVETFSTVKEEKTPVPDTEVVGITIEEEKEDVKSSPVTTSSSNTSLSVVPSFLYGLTQQKLSSVSSGELSIFNELTGNIFREYDSIYSIPFDPEIKPLEGIEIRDSKGKLSAILREVSKRTGLRIIPASFTHVPVDAILTDYYVFRYKSELYFAPVEYSDVIAKCTDSIKKSLSEETPSIFAIAKKKDVEGRQILNMLLSPREVTHLYTLFANYTPKIVDSGLEADSPLKLVIGDYIVRG